MIYTVSINLNSCADCGSPETETALTLTDIVGRRYRETIVVRWPASIISSAAEEIIDASHVGLKLGVDPLGGASFACWEPINRLYGLAIEVVNKQVDPRFAFMTLDHDGEIRMDCASPYAMANLVRLRIVSNWPSAMTPTRTATAS